MYDGKFRSASFCRRPSIQTVSKALDTSRKNAPVRLYSPFQVIPSKRLANCTDVLCLGRNLKCSPRISQLSLNSYKILVSRILSNTSPALSKRLTDQLDEGCAGSSLIQHESWLFYTVFLLFCLVCYWSVGRFVGVVPRAAFTRAYLQV